MLRFLALAMFGLTTIVGLVPTRAVAQDDDEAGRAAFEEGVAASEAGDWETAASSFERAYSRSGRIWLLFNVATARMNNDDLVGAAQTFQRFQRECDAASGDQREACDDKREEARRELQRVQREAPRVEVTADPGELLIDGEPTTRGEILVNPGEHTLTLRTEGREVDRATIVVTAGEREMVSLHVPQAISLDPDPDIIADPVDPEPFVDGDSAPPIGGVLLLAAGGATALAGGAMMFFGERDDLEVQDAPDGAPWSEYEGTHNRAKRRYRIGGALVGVGVAAAAVGLVLVLRSGDEDADGEVQSEVRFGFGHVSYRTRF